MLLKSRLIGLQTKPVQKVFLITVTLALSLFACTPAVDDKPEATTNPSATDGVNPYATSDQSPMDVAYLPADYPILKMNGSADSASLVARIFYSRPQRKGRRIFGNSNKVLCPYGKQWRLGANEATEIEWFRDVTIGGKPLKQGRYVMYCIPYPEKWVIAFNTNLFTWGLHMDNTKDVLRLEIPVSVQAPPLEEFTMLFQPSETDAELLMAWDNVKASLPLGFDNRP